MDDPTKDLMEISDRMYTLTGQLIQEGQKPFAIAAIHTMLAMQIYKTLLSEKDYNEMIDSISSNRDKVATLTQIAKSKLN